MLSTLAVLGYIAALIAPVMCCRTNEYETKDGECCSSCLEGSVVRRDCTQTSGTRCSPCVNGTYMNKPNGLTKCFLCTSCDRGHGLFAQQECTTTTDTICDVLSGYFCKHLMDGAGCSLAKKHTPCEPGHRVKEPGTSRTDTVCEPCQPGHFSQDGLNCMAWNSCSETRVKVEEGSSSSDVVCGAASRERFYYIPLIMATLLSLALVIAGYVAALIAPAMCCLSKEYKTRDGECCPMCHEGSVVRRDCTQTSGTRCSPCVNGTYMNKPNGLTNCFLCTSCDRGHGLFAQQECTTKTDTICDVLSGYFCKHLMDGAGCSLAEKHSPCAPGHRVKEPGTSRTDTVCEPCQPGHFSQDGLYCTAWTSCSETRVKVKGSSSSDVVCGAASRERFYYIPLIMATLLSLALVIAGYIAALIAPAMCCLPKEYETRDGECCPMCHEGSVVRRDCTQTSGTRCSNCGNGTYMNQPNGLTNCFLCTSCDRGHGLFAQQECTTTTDTICDVLSGYFCKHLMDGAGCSLAEKHTPCEPGHRVKEPGTSRTDTVCEPCQPGHFSQHGLNCTVWTSCSETQVKIKGSSSSDVVCGAASRQRFCYIPLIMATLLSLALVITGIKSSKKTETSPQSDRHTEEDSPG